MKCSVNCNWILSCNPFCLHLHITNRAFGAIFELVSYRTNYQVQQIKGSQLTLRIIRYNLLELDSLRDSSASSGIVQCTFPNEMKSVQLNWVIENHYRCDASAAVDLDAVHPHK